MVADALKVGFRGWVRRPAAVLRADLDNISHNLACVERAHPVHNAYFAA